MFWRVLAAAALVATVSCSAADLSANTDTVAGSGTLATQSRHVSGFSAVNLQGTGRLVIRQSGTESLSVTAEKNLLPYLTSKVSNGTLTLSTKEGVNLRPTKGIRYEVTVKRLTGISIAGYGDVSATGVSTSALRVSLSGTGTITVAGSADAQTVVLSGSGTYTAPGLRSKTADVTISGSGGATLTVRDRLDVTISGSGSVRYSGRPTVSEHISGSGTVAPR